MGGAIVCALCGGWLSNLVRILLLLRLLLLRLLLLLLLLLLLCYWRAYPCPRPCETLMRNVCLRLSDRVWVGEEHPQFDAASNEPSSKSVGAQACADFLAWAKAAKRHVAQECGGEGITAAAVRVELQGEESDEFWDAFDEGAAL